MQDLEKKFNKLKKQLAEIDYFCTGSISVVYTKCGNDYCACFKDDSKKHGPYYLWSTKKKGKTISTRLSKKQVAKCLQFIRNFKKLKNIIEKMKDISMKVVDNY